MPEPVNQVAAPDAPAAPAFAVRQLKDDERRSVWLIERPGQELRTLKTWPASIWFLIKHAMGASQAHRLIRGVQRLIAARVPTPGVLQRPVRRRRHGRRCIDVELEYAPGRTALEVLADDSTLVERQTAWAREIGSIVASIVCAKLVHGDLKLENLVIDESAAQPTVWVVDAADVRHTAKAVESTAWMLDRLVVQPINREVDLPRVVWMTAMRAAMRFLSRADRRAVIERLRAHLAA